MKTPMLVRSFATLLLVGAMLSPISVPAFADGGKKHFNAGMKYEVSEQWDKAAEEFALAVETLARRAIDVAPLLTAQFPVDRAAEAFALAADRSRAMKVQIAF